MANSYSLHGFLCRPPTCRNDLVFPAQLHGVKVNAFAPSFSCPLPQGRPNHAGCQQWLYLARLRVREIAGGGTCNKLSHERLPTAQILIR